MGCQCCRAAQWSKAKWDAASENGTKPVIWWGDNASSSRSNLIRSFLTLVVIIITGQPDKIQVWLKTVFFLRDFCNWFKGPSDALNTPQVCRDAVCSPFGFKPWEEIFCGFFFVNRSRRLDPQSSKASDLTCVWELRKQVLLNRSLNPIEVQ